MNKNEKQKIKALKEQGNFNPRSRNVKDELFQEHDFFDSDDLMQVKYEMIRRVEKNEWAVTKATEKFGLSRPSFYAARKAFEKEGLPGLLPEQRGPKGPHKLSDEVMGFIDSKVAENKRVRAKDVTLLIEEKFKIKVHPRTIERVLVKRKKKGRKGNKK